MNKKQTFYFFIIFFFLLAVITIPLWLDSAMPYLRDHSLAAIDAVEHWIDELKQIAGEVKFNIGAAKF